MASILRSLALVLVCMIALSARAQAPGTHAESEHAVRGEKLFATGHYAEAIDELRAAFIVTGQPRFLYALGQAYRANHQCVEAVQAYRDFVRANPSHDQTAAAEERIKLCGEENPSSLATPTTPPPTPTVIAPVAPTPIIAAPPTPVIAVVEQPAAPPPHKPVYKRWWLWTTVGVAAVGLGVGLGVGLTRTYGFHPSVTPFGPNTP